MLDIDENNWLYFIIMVKQLDAVFFDYFFLKGKMPFFIVSFEHFFSFVNNYLI